MEDIDLLEIANSITYNINNGYDSKAIKELKNFAKEIKKELLNNVIIAQDPNGDVEVVSKARIKETFNIIKAWEF